MIVTSWRTQTLDQEVFLLHGIDVMRYKIVALKSSDHFRGAFIPITAEITRTEMASEAARLFKLRERLREGIQAQVTDAVVNGSLEHRLPGNLNISFPYVEGEAMLMGLKDVAVSSGSACTSASLEPSYVLRALGVAEEMAHTSIRFGLGRFNTEEEVDHVTKLVVDKVKKLRELSPLYEMAQQGIDLKSITWAAH